MRHFSFVNYNWYCDMTGYKKSHYESLMSFKKLCKAIDNMEVLVNE